MPKVNSKEALKELLFNIQQKDLIKARLVVEHLAGIDPSREVASVPKWLKKPPKPR